MPAFLIALVCALSLWAPRASSALSLDKFDAMIEWLDTHPNFVSHVEMGTNANGIRGIFATRDMDHGDAIITVPPTAVISVGGYRDQDAWTEPAARLLAELRNPHSRFKAYLDTMPASDEVPSLCNFPEEYAEMMPSTYWIEAYQVLQQQLKDYLAGNSTDFPTLTLAEALGLDAKDVTLDELRYACSLAATRTVQGDPRETHFMIPLFDLANHRDNCSIFLGAYGNWFPDDGSFNLVAAEPIKKGDEICYGYKSDGRDDDFFFGYGYLPSVKERPHLMKEDGTFHPPYLLSVDAADNAIQAEAFPLNEPFIGTHENRISEITRLKAIYENHLKHVSDHPNPEPLPGHEYLHAQLKELQLRRALSLLAEISRLEAIPESVSVEHKKPKKPEDEWDEEEEEEEEHIEHAEL